MAAVPYWPDSCCSLVTLYVKLGCRGIRSEIPLHHRRGQAGLHCWASFFFPQAHDSTVTRGTCFASKRGDFCEVCRGSREQYWFKLQRQDIFLWEMMYILQQQAISLSYSSQLGEHQKTTLSKIPSNCSAAVSQQQKGALTVFTQTGCSIKGQWV